jgi:hypothetical protein
MPDNKDYFIISNPIYDVVFRYLMEDLESARLILSTFLNQEIIHIQPEPTEKPVKVSKAFKKTKTGLIKENVLSLFRLDFLATVRSEDGTEEVVMIEVQKAYNTNDYFRFKRYIAENFQKKREEIKITKRGKKKKVFKPIRLIPIFILNFTIEDEVKELFIKTKPTSTCVFHNKKLENTTEFIDNLTYELWVVQIPYLNEVKEEDYIHDEYKTKVYTMLKLFDQESVYGDDNEHKLRLLRDKFPEEWNRVIQRLQSAASDNAELEEIMFLEDEYLKDLQEMENDIAAKDLLLEENKKTIEESKKTIEENKKAIEEKEKAIEEKEKAIEEKEKAIEESKKTIEENRKAIEEKEKALQEKDKLIYNMAKLLKETGVSIVDIHKKTGLSVEEIERI